MTVVLSGTTGISLSLNDIMLFGSCRKGLVKLLTVFQAFYGTVVKDCVFEMFLAFPAFVLVDKLNACYSNVLFHQRGWGKY